jgi:single-strand DNA-binding protein
MLNHITLMGRLTKDVELRRTNDGTPVASFTLAVTRDFVPKGGERETDFIDVVAWKNNAEFAHTYFGKGRMAVVDGRLQMRKWTDDNGNNRTTYEIVADNVYFGEGKRKESDQTTTSNHWDSPHTTTQNPYSGPWMYGGVKPAVDFAMLDDDDAQLPF